MTLKPKLETIQYIYEPLNKDRTLFLYKKDDIYSIVGPSFNPDKVISFQEEDILTFIDRLNSDDYDIITYHIDCVLKMEAMYYSMKVGSICNLLNIDRVTIEEDLNHMSRQLKQITDKYRLTLVD